MSHAFFWGAFVAHSKCLYVLVGRTMDHEISGWGHVHGAWLETSLVAQPMPRGGSHWVDVSEPDFEDPPLIPLSVVHGLFDRCAEGAIAVNSWFSKLGKMPFNMPSIQAPRAAPAC